MNRFSYVCVHLILMMCGILHVKNVTALCSEIIFSCLFFSLLNGNIVIRCISQAFIQ